MNAKAIHVDPKVVVEMTMREAEILRALLGGIDYKAVSESTRAMKELFDVLAAAGVKPETESFSNFFNGRVETKVTTPSAGVKTSKAAP